MAESKEFANGGGNLDFTKKNHRKKLNPDDSPNDQLLMRVAHHVKYSKTKLFWMAKDVGMSEGRYTQKTVPHREALVKIVEVLFPQNV